MSMRFAAGFFRVSALWARPSFSIRRSKERNARFLAFRTPNAQRWCGELAARNCIVDVRGDVLRVGLGLYHDEGDVDRFAEMAAGLAA
jgi:selenocysteine lyase/cysteine desulfurase